MNNFTNWSKKSNRKLMSRLRHRQEITAKPIFNPGNIRYDFSEKISAISFGGIGTVHALIKKIQFDIMLNKMLYLLKIHNPYHESDHILNMAYNLLCGGHYIEDLELLRNNPAYLNAIGAKRIPDPTTAGDFLRRFGMDDVITLMETMNQANRIVWAKSENNLKNQDAFIDVDGTITKTYGEKKEKMDMSYKGQWGFNPLVITEATTGAHLYLVNRPGNVASHEGSAPFIDRAIADVRDSFRSVYLRGDSDFSLTENFDKWNREVNFVFAYDSKENLEKRADLLGKNEWKILPYEKRKIKTKERLRKKNQKNKVVIRREYNNMKRKKEYIAEFEYQPGKCEKPYRMVVIKRIIKVTKGQLYLKDEERYFFYITNIPAEEKSPAEVVRLYRGRANHENRLEQLKNGVSALNMPASEFLANWAYMAICSLAWNIKSWLGLIDPNTVIGQKIIAIEFKRFKNIFMNIPCQILRSSGSVIYRMLGYSPPAVNVWRLFHHIKTLRFT
jgi:hypothetical protein